MSTQPSTGKQRILAAAGDLFLSKGYGETSLREIAAAAGIQPASIYHHFSSKEVLFTAVLRIGTDFTTTAFDETAKNLAPGAEPEAVVFAHIEAHLAALFDHGPYTAANVVVFSIAPEAVKAAVVPIRDAYEQRWEDLFQCLADTGQLRPDLDVRMARRIVLGSINSTLEWFNPQLHKKDAQTVTDLAQAMTNLVWKGIGVT